MSSDPFAIDKSGPIRRFLDTELQEKVDAALAQHPDKHLAVVAAASQDGVGVEACFHKKDGAWTLCLKAEKRWGGDFAGQVAVVYTPF